MLHVSERLRACIDALCNNCRERNSFLKLLSRYDLETTMTLLQWSEDRKQKLRELINSS